MNDLLKNMPFGQGGKMYAILPGYGDKQIEIIFQDQYEAAKLADMLFDETAPQATIDEEIAEMLKQNDLIKINNKIYKVSSKQPDGEGLTVIILKK
jgi:hypothetical protein